MNPLSTPNRWRSIEFAAVIAFASLGVNAAEKPPSLPTELRLDFAYYSPASLVLKKQGWVEQDVASAGVKVSWVQSAGSNRALEYLNSGSIDFGSTAGLAAVLGRANGNPIKNVWIFSRPEWTALAVAKDSPIHSVTDLKGKKIAATKGTDPYLFLLRSLHDFGLSKNDVQIVGLPHADGRTALEKGDVDAWAGLDPFLAASQLQNGTRLIYRKVEYNTWGFLNTPEKFAHDYPDAVRLVLRDYERARQWILAHPDDTAQLLAESANLPIDVARLQLSRTDFSKPIPGAEQIAALKAAAPILHEEALVRDDVDLNAVIDSLITPDFAIAVLKSPKS